MGQGRAGRNVLNGWSSLRHEEFQLVSRQFVDPCDTDGEKTSCPIATATSMSLVRIIPAFLNSLFRFWRLVDLFRFRVDGGIGRVGGRAADLQLFDPSQQ